MTRCEFTVPVLALTRIYDSADPASIAEVARVTSRASKGSIGVTLESSPAFSEDFRDLVHTQLSLLLEILRYAHTLHILQQSVSYHCSPMLEQFFSHCRQPQWQATLFARAPQSFSTGELDLLRIASAGPGLCECRDSHLLLASTDDAEDTLSGAEVLSQLSQERPVSFAVATP